MARRNTRSRSRATPFRSPASTGASSPSAGQVHQDVAAGRGRANPSCASYKPQDNDPTENAQSVGSVITFGKFRVAHLGDLTWNKEFDLMCPINRIGTVDLFVVSHHGQPISNSRSPGARDLHPRVAIMNNGTRKGGQPDADEDASTPRPASRTSGRSISRSSADRNTRCPGMFIANLTDEPLAAMPVAPIAAPAPGPNAPPPPGHNGPAFWIKVSAQQDGTFTVTNAAQRFCQDLRGALTRWFLGAGGTRASGRLPMCRVHGRPAPRAIAAEHCGNRCGQSHFGTDPCRSIFTENGPLSPARLRALALPSRAGLQKQALRWFSTGAARHPSRPPGSA